MLHEEVCKFANVLKANGVPEGRPRLPVHAMVPELGIAALACSRIGAIHGIVFGGFSADALRDRIVNSGAKVLVVCDGTFRGNKAVPRRPRRRSAALLPLH
jgi:acetyl-CoA synthetase